MACGFSATERTLLAFALEASYGTAAPSNTTSAGVIGAGATTYATDGATIPAGDQITIYDSFSPIQANIEAIQLNPATGDLGPGDFLPGRSLFTIQFDFCLFGSGTANAPPHYLELLRICGYRRFNVATGATLTAPTAVAASGGVLYAGVYRYAIAQVTDGVAGATPWLITPIKLVATDTAVTLNQKVTVTFVDGAAGTGKRTFVFRSHMNETTAAGPYFFLADAGATATTYVDDHTTDPQLGVEYPGGTSPLGNGAATWYLPPSGDSCPESATMAVWLDGEVLMAKGVRGTISQIQLPAGGISKCTFQGQGLYLDPVAATNPAFSARSTPPQFQAAACKIWYEDPANLGKMYMTTVNSALTVTPFIPKVRSVTIATGTQITERRDANDANAVTELGIVRKFQPRFGINYEADATYPAIRSMKNGLYAYSGCVIGPGTTGRNIKINAARLRYQSNPTYGDSEGYRTFDSTWVAGGGGGADYLSFLHY